MAIKIEGKIAKYAIKGNESATQSSATADDSNPQEGMAQVIQMHERLERPEMLVGSTYKIKTPLSEHALYATINDIVLNPGTAHEQRRPFEIFINSKNMEHFQWIVALTRIISAVFRKGGDVTFLVEELHSVFDPRGGYFKRGGKYMPSLVAEIGDAIESHLIQIGLLKREHLDEHQQAHIAEKRAEYETLTVAPDSKATSDSISSDSISSDSGARHAVEEETSQFPESAQLCLKCNHKAVIMMDGCMTCLNCGDSKCG